MEKLSITEKDLTEVQCYDFSIQTLPSKTDFLILMCKRKEGAAKLINILRNNAFDLKIYIDTKTGNYSLYFHFIDVEIIFQFDTGKNETSYPPLKKLKNSQIKFITTGIWTGDSPRGRTCEYDPYLMRLGLFEIGDSFKQAVGVQFIRGHSDNEPSVVVLTYKDYNHIFETEADEAYNRLSNMTKSRPLLEIYPLTPDTVNLRIWDILIDLDVQFDGLKYEAKQLGDFLEKTDENDSFAFGIGFQPSDGVKVALASTKKDGFELITLRGYTLKK